MKTHIFIGSTFYDLKYKQEDLSSFVKVHDYEPIMFEDGGLTLTDAPGDQKSHFETMKLADMVILIVGGNYAAESESGKDGYAKGREFKEAIEEGVPVYAFIDRQVYAEYGVYEVNAESIDQDDNFIKFRATKDVNVFRFINEIKDIANISIAEFSRLEEIKDFLSAEWSAMFKTHLKSLRVDKQTDELDTTLSKFRSLIEDMNVSLSGAEDKILNAKEELMAVQESQAAQPPQTPQAPQTQTPPVQKEKVEVKRGEAQVVSEKIANSISIKENDITLELNVEYLISELAGYYSRNEEKIKTEYQDASIPKEELENEFLIPLFSRGLSVEELHEELFSDLRVMYAFQTGEEAQIKQILLSDETLSGLIFTEATS